MSEASGVRPRVLWITDEPPDRSLGGGNIRQAHLLAGLGRVAEVCLLVMGEVTDDHVHESVGEVLEVPTVPLSAPRTRTGSRLLRLWLVLAATGPWEVALTARRRRRLRGTVAELAPRFDVVVVTHLGMAGLLPRHRTNRWALQLHHVSSAKAAQERALVAGRRKRWIRSREVAKAQRFERWAVDAFDVVITVSEEDADHLPVGGGAEARGRMLVAPNGVDTDLYRPSPLPTEARIVMTGSLGYGPNLDGVMWFCDEVLPLVRDRVPAATLALVGRSPASEVRALGGRDGVEVHADVPSVLPWLAEARVAVVPLRVGTGTRLKALEAMAAGRPVVGTTIGLAGLGLVDGHHALMADDVPAMADAVAAVLADRSLAERLARSGRELVEERFEWSAIADDLATSLLDRVGPRTGQTA